MWEGLGRGRGRTWSCGWSGEEARAREKRDKGDRGIKYLPCQVHQEKHTVLADRLCNRRYSKMKIKEVYRIRGMGVTRHTVRELSLKR